jgi:hypothetical protein
MTASDLAKLRTDLTAAAKITEAVRAVTVKAAVNVKKGWRENAAATAPVHAKAYPYSITFDDPTVVSGTISVEIGPDKGKRQGALGNLLEYGSANNPPHNDGKRAAEAEHDAFASYVLKAGGEALW